MIKRAAPGYSQDGGFLIKNAEEPFLEDHFQRSGDGMKYLVYLLIITHPAGYAEVERKYPMQDLGLCQRTIDNSKIGTETTVMTCVTETVAGDE